MAECDCQSLLWWRTDAEYAPVTFFIQCSDEFDLATADCERVTPENLQVLKDAIKDCQVAEKDKWAVYGPLLFCARVRKMRPMKMSYPKDEPAVGELFDAAGPER
jgi:hypothetical protein